MRRHSRWGALVAPLLRKELRALLPLLVLCAALFGLNLLYVPLVERLDEVSWTGAMDGAIRPGGDGALSVLLLIVSLVVAYSLFPREHDDGTIAFLYSLPTTRGRVFLAKVTAGALVLAGGVLAQHLVAWLLQLPNGQSFTGEQFRLATAAKHAFLEGAFCAVILAHGVLASFLRRFGLILYFGLVWAVLGLQDLSPAFGWLDASHLLDLDYDGRRLLIPWGALAVHAGVAAAALGAAALLWTGAAERFTAAWLGATAAPLGKVALGCGTAALVGLLFAFSIYLAVKAEDSDREPVVYPDFHPVAVETARYELVYPDAFRARSLRLIRRADAIHAEVRAALGAEPGARIVADLTEVSPHHAGIASWEKIRVGVAAATDEAELRRTFAHETVHAFQYRLSDRRLREKGRSVRFFAEGLAEWVAWEVVPDPELRRANRLLAVAAWRRHRLRFAELTDDDAFRAAHDSHLVYPVGETWCQALVDVAGPEAPGDVLRALARPDAPRDLAGVELWQDTLQALGLELEAVNAAWEARLAALAEAEAEALAALPRLGGGVVAATAGELLLRASADPLPPDAADWTWLVRVRSGPADEDVDYRVYEGRLQPDGRLAFEVPKGVLRGRSFDLQLGAQPDPRVLPFYEDWQTALVR